MGGRKPPAKLFVRDCLECHFALSRNRPLDAGLKLAVLALMIVAIHVLWLLAGAAFARFLRKPLASRIINLTFAATLVLTTALAVVP